MAEARKIKQFIKDNYYGSFIDMIYNNESSNYTIMYSLNSQLMKVDISKEKYKEIINS